MQASDKVSEDGMQDRRTIKRQKSFLHGRILFNNRQSSVDCLVKDISEKGARLKISDAITTPEVIELYIPNKDETHRARVMWRHLDEMGVSFGLQETFGPHPEAAASVELVDRVHKLEQDVAKLRRLLNELRMELRQKQSED